MAIHSPEFRRKRQRRRRITAGIVFLAFVLVVGGVVYASHLERFIIKDVRIEGNHVTRDEDLARIAKDRISGKYLWLFPRANAAIYPRKSLSASILSEVPRIKEVELKLLDPKTLSVSVEERSPHALYCADVSDPVMPAGCFFLDDAGLIFSKAPSFSGTVYFIYTSEIPLDEPLGQHLIAQDKYGEMSAFIDQTERMDIGPRVLVLSDSAYRLRLADGGEVIWRPEESPMVVLRNLEAFLADEEVKGQEDFIEKILYIDLRFKNKVFYKFRGEEASETTTATTTPAI